MPKNFLLRLMTSTGINSISCQTLSSLVRIALYGVMMSSKKFLISHITNMKMPIHSMEPHFRLLFKLMSSGFITLIFLFVYNNITF